MNKHIEALKLALDYLESRGLAWNVQIALREALREHAMREVQRLGQEIEQEPVGDEWTPCIKLPVIVHVRKQRHGETHVSTREGITPVNLEDLIMRGVSGEEYPIGRAIFEQTYSLDTTPPQRKPLTDEQTIILKNTTCPEIDWKARYFVEMNNGERNKWMLEWFIAFKVAIEAAHGITGEKK